MRRTFVTGACLAALILVAVAGYLVLGNNERGSSLYIGPGGVSVFVPAGAAPPGTRFSLAEATPARLPQNTQRLGATMQITTTSAVGLSAPVTVTFPYDTKAARPTGMVPLVLVEQAGTWNALEPKEDAGAGKLVLQLSPGDLGSYFDLLASPHYIGISGVNLTPILARLTERESDHFVVRYVLGQALVDWGLEKRLEAIYQYYKDLGFRPPDIETESTTRVPNGQKFVVHVNLWESSGDILYKLSVQGIYNPSTRAINLNLLTDASDYALSPLGLTAAFATTLPHEYFHALQFAYGLRPYLWGKASGGEPPYWTWLIEPTAATAGATYYGGGVPQRDAEKPVMALDGRLTRLPDLGGVGLERYALQDFLVYVARAAGVKDNRYLKTLFECVPGSPSTEGAPPSPTSLECLDRMIKSAGLSGLPDAYAGFVRSGYLRMRGNRQAVNAYARDGVAEATIDREVSHLLTPRAQATGEFSFDLEQWQSRLLKVEARSVPGSGTLRLSLKDGRDARGWAWALADDDRVDMASEVTSRDGVLQLEGWGQKRKTVEVLLANASDKPQHISGAFSVVPVTGQTPTSGPATSAPAQPPKPAPAPKPAPPPPVQAQALLADSIAAMRSRQTIEVRSKADLLAMSSSSHVVLNLPDNVDGEGDAAGIAWSATSAQGRTELKISGQTLGTAPSKGMATQVRDALLSIPAYGSAWTVRTEKGSYRLEGRMSTDGLDTILRGTGVQIPGNPKAKMVLTIDPGAKLWQTLDVVLLWPIVDYTVLGQEIELGPAATTSLDFGNRTAPPATDGGQVLGASVSDDERELAKSTVDGVVTGLGRVEVLKPLAAPVGVVFAFLDLRQAITMLGEEPRERAALQAARQRYGENSLQYDNALRRYRDWEYRMPLVGPFLRFILPRPVSSR